MYFEVLGKVLGSGMREDLDWSEMMVEWVLIESLAKDPLGSGHIPHWGS